MQFSSRTIGSARGTQLYALATLAAILVCGAGLLNLGPFSKVSRVADIPPSEPVQTAVLIEHSTALRPSPAQPVAAMVAQPRGQDAAAPSAPSPSQSTLEAEGLSERLKVSMHSTAFSLVEVPSWGDPSPDLNRGSTNVARHEVVFTEPVNEANSVPGSAEKPTIVGVWAPDAGTCSVRDFQSGLLPTVINAEGAWAGETFCVFIKRTENDAGWSVVAKCSTPRERWTSRVRLTVDGDRLTWTSKRGTQAYTRCAPDVLMVQAAR